jgi:hypothetical protein
MPDLDPFQPINAEDFKPTDLPKGDDPEAQMDPASVGMEDNVDIGQGDAEDSLDDFESELGQAPAAAPDPAAAAPADPAGGLGGDVGLPEPTEIAPAEPEKQVKWTTIPTDDNEIKSKHVGGFLLRSKPLSSRQGEKTKYITQLYKGNKILEKGVIWIDSSKDPRTYLQNVSDRILNRMGLSSNEIEKPKPEEPAMPEAGAEAGAEPIPGAEGAPEGGEAAPGGGEGLPEEGGEPGAADLPGEEPPDELGGDIDKIMGSI